MKKTKHKASYIDKTVGQNLFKIRKLNKLRQIDIATMLNVSIQQIQKYEKGVNRLSLANAYILCNNLSITLEELINEKK